VKHSAKGIAKLARERERQARLAAEASGPAAGQSAPPAGAGPVGDLADSAVPGEPGALAEPAVLAGPAVPPVEPGVRRGTAVPAAEPGVRRGTAVPAAEPAVQRADTAETPLRATEPVSQSSPAPGFAGEATGTPVTARPATAIPGRSRPAVRRLTQLPYAVVVAGVLAGLGLMRSGMQEVKSGTLVVAGALLAGSLARLVLPDGRAGLLGSRRRLVDVAALTALGVGLLIAGLIVKVPG
jgi:hypothetical protein